MSADTAIMPIPGPVDPVPVPRAATPRADGRIELVGLRKEQIRAELERGGLDARVLGTTLRPSISQSSLTARRR